MGEERCFDKETVCEVMQATENPMSIPGAQAPSWRLEMGMQRGRGQIPKSLLLYAKGFGFYPE